MPAPSVVVKVTRGTASAPRRASPRKAIRSRSWSALAELLFWPALLAYGEAAFAYLLIHATKLARLEREVADLAQRVKGRAVG